MNRVLILLFLMYSNIGAIYAQDVKKYDHTLLIDRLKKSEGDKYKEIISSYDNYLIIHPNDIGVLIEKARFVSLAQYNEIDDFNPNSEYLDSLNESIYRKFPNEPLIIEYKISNLWGDEKKQYLADLLKKFIENNSIFNKSTVGLIYYEASDIAYSESKFKDASNNMQKAMHYDSKYEYSLLNAKIWIELNNNDLALKVLNDKRDTTQNLLYISEKAKLFLLVKSYDKAIDLYNKIDDKDSVFINNLDLSQAFDGAQKHQFARKYLLKDTTNNWQKQKTYLNLFLHDLKFQEGKYGISSYNSFRDLGFENDFFAIYRLKLFLKHPLTMWSFRDLFGIVCLFAFVCFLFALPSVFILPVYVLWQRKITIGEIINYKFNWGLKSIWLISFGYLFLFFFSSVSDTEAFYASFKLDESQFVLTNEISAFPQMVFMIILGTIIGVMTTKRKWNFINSKSKTVFSIVLMSIGYLFAFKVVSGIYIHFGRIIFDINSTDLASLNPIFSTIEDQVKSLIVVYGIWVALLMVGIIVPVYEEIMFRGILLNGFSNYIGFKNSNILQAALFGLLHQDLFLFPIYMLFGWLCGQMTRKNDSLLPNIIFHILNNLIATMALNRML